MNMRFTRRISAVTLTVAGVLLATGSLYALRRPPFLSWIRDQSKISSQAPNFDTQYFRVKDFDGNDVSFTINSSNSAVFNKNNVMVGLCDPMIDPTCTGLQDMTGYKVFFMGPALSAGATTITVIAKGKNGGATAYTSFTLRWAPAAFNPPTVEALPNAVLQLKPDGTAKYSTMFVIGDLVRDMNGKLVEDLDSIGTSNFTVTSSNPSLLPNDPNNISLTLMPLPAGYIDPATPRTYLLEATTLAGALPGYTVVTVELRDLEMPIPNRVTTSFVL